VTCKNENGNSSFSLLVTHQFLYRKNGSFFMRKKKQEKGYSGQKTTGKQNPA
jgi:hypothetical protein